MRIPMLIFGTRGEVQPLTALGLGLQAAGHTVCMVTQASFYDFVSRRGLECVPIVTDLRKTEQSNNKAGTIPIYKIYQLARQHMAKSLAGLTQDGKLPRAASVLG